MRRHGRLGERNWERVDPPLPDGDEVIANQAGNFLAPCPPGVAGLESLREVIPVDPPNFRDKADSQSRARPLAVADPLRAYDALGVGSSVTRAEAAEQCSQETVDC